MCLCDKVGLYDVRVSRPLTCMDREATAVLEKALENMSTQMRRVGRGVVEC